MNMSKSDEGAVPIERGKHGPLVGAVDQGTSSTRFLVSCHLCFRIIPLFTYVKVYSLLDTLNSLSC